MARAPRSCEFCGNALVGGRSDRRFCDGSCRAAAARQRAEADVAVRGAVRLEGVNAGGTVTVEQLRERISRAEPQLVGLVLRQAVERGSWSAARWLLQWSRERGDVAPRRVDDPIWQELDAIYAHNLLEGKAVGFDEADADEPDALADNAIRRQAGLA